ncbi:unnamed protein product, partial [marine sediment metagenome]
IITLVLTANPPGGFTPGTFDSTYTWEFMVTDPSAATHTYTLQTSAANGSPIDFPEINVKQGTTDLPDGMDDIIIQGVEIDTRFVGIDGNGKGVDALPRRDGKQRAQVVDTGIHRLIGEHRRSKEQQKQNSSYDHSRFSTEHGFSPSQSSCSV